MCLPSCDMALRTRSARSGPGRARASDGRARDGRVADGRARDLGSRSGPGRGMYRPARRRARLRGGRVAAASITAPRRRADALFEGSPGGTGPAEPPGAILDAAVGRSRAERRAVAAADVDIGADVDFGTSARQRMRLAVRERLPLWLQLRCGLEPRALAALAVVLVLAAGFAVQHFWVGRPQTVRAPELVQQGAATPEPRPSPGHRRPIRGLAAGGSSSSTSAARCGGRGCTGCPRDPGWPTPCGRRVASERVRT